MRIALTHSLEEPEPAGDGEPPLPAAMNTLAGALRRLGHEVVPIDVDGALGRLVAALDSARPDLVFNTAEGRAVRSATTFYPTVFDGLGLPWVGSSPRAAGLASDTFAARALAARLGVPTPQTWVGRPGDIPEGVALPAVVARRHPGRDQAATTVTDRAALLAAVDALGDDVVITEGLAGRDVAVPWIAGVGDDGGALTPQPREPEAPPVGLSAYARLVAWSRDLASAFGVGDLARFDWRVDDDAGEVWFLGFTLLPSLGPGSSVARAAAAAGLADLDAVLDALVRAACARLGLDPGGRPARGELHARVGLVFNLKRVAPSVDGRDDDEAEFDSPKTVNAIAAAITSLGHEVVLLEADRTLLTRVGEADVDVVFNIAEGIRGRGREALVPAVLELLDIPYTGSDAVTLAVTLDKALAKRIVKDHGVPIAPFVVMTSPDEPLPPELTFPMIVKPVAEGSSKGVMAASVVHDEPGLRAVVRELLGRYRQGALVEAFLSGREFTIGLLGGSHPRVLPPMEVVFHDAAGPTPVYSFQHKLDAGDQVSYQVPADVDEALGAELTRVAVRSWEALGCRDVARIDIRLDDAGRACFIECNPLPGLTPDWSDLCIIGKGCGLSYEDIIAEILAPALARLERRRREESA